MKKILLSLGILASAAAAQAQSVTFGVKAGGTLSSITQKDNDNNNYKFGGHGGVFANFGINDMFSVQPEVLYSMKGNKQETSGTLGGTTYKTDHMQTLNYIDVPVMVKVSTGDDNSGLFFEAGPQVGFLLSAKDKYDTSSTTGSTTTATSGDTDNKDTFNTVDFGYAVGLGYQASSGPLVGLRYNGGLTDISKGTALNADHNDAFQLYVGFRLGGR